MPRFLSSSLPAKKTVSAPRATIPRQVSSIVPKTMNTTLVYYDYYNLTTGAASYAAYSFRANSCRDPYAGVGGGAPSGFTELSYLYQHIHVNSIDVSAWGYNTCATPLIIGWFFRSSHGSVLTPGPAMQQTLMEMPNVSGAVATTLPSGSGFGYSAFKSSASRSISSIEGHPTSDQDYGSTFGLEPTTQCYADLCIVSADGAATASTANAHVRLVYHVSLSEPNQTYTD